MKNVRAAAGNRFVTWNVDLLRPGSRRDQADFDGSLEEAAEAAVALCMAERVDGLMAFSRATQAGDLRITFFNADGSRPEACGNGLRAAARHARELGWVADDVMIFETDAGIREARLLRDEGAIQAAEVSLGEARDHGDQVLEVAGKPGEVTVAHIELGNPHAVLFVDDPRHAHVRRLGPEIECHERFPERINVGFAAVSASGGTLALRVWERGVGETKACGTGAAAAALAAVNRGRATWPVAVNLPGGRLVVRAGSQGELWLTGPC